MTRWPCLSIAASPSRSASLVSIRELTSIFRNTGRSVKAPRGGKGFSAAVGAAVRPSDHLMPSCTDQCSHGEPHETHGTVHSHPPPPPAATCSAAVQAVAPLLCAPLLAGPSCSHQPEPVSQDSRAVPPRAPCCWSTCRSWRGGASCSPRPRPAAASCWPPWGSSSRWVQGGRSALLCIWEQRTAGEQVMHGLIWRHARQPQGHSPCCSFLLPTPTAGGGEQL